MRRITAVEIDRLSSEIEKIINRMSLENCVGMNDYVIGDYLAQCFKNLNEAIIWQVTLSQKGQSNE